MSNFIEKLEQYFKETPKEKVLEDWAKTTESDKVGITVSDFVNGKCLEFKVGDKVMIRDEDKREYRYKFTYRSDVGRSFTILGSSPKGEIYEVECNDPKKEIYYLHSKHLVKANNSTIKRHIYGKRELSAAFAMQFYEWCLNDLKLMLMESGVSLEPIEAKEEKTIHVPDTPILPEDLMPLTDMDIDKELNRLNSKHE